MSKPGVCGKNPGQRLPQDGVLKRALCAGAGPEDIARFDEGTTHRLIKSANRADRIVGMTLVGSRGAKASARNQNAVAALALNHRSSVEERHLAIIYLSEIGPIGINALVGVFKDDRSKDVIYTGRSVLPAHWGKNKVTMSLELLAGAHLFQTSAGKRKMHSIAIRPKPRRYWVVAVLFAYPTYSDILEVTTQALWEVNTPLLVEHAIDALGAMFYSAHESESDDAQSIFESLVSFSLAKNTAPSRLRALAEKKVEAFRPLLVQQ